jgi:hypothetical protein
MSFWFDHLVIFDCVSLQTTQESGYFIVILSGKHFRLGMITLANNLHRHTISGLVATFIESPLDLQKDLKIPADQYDACSAQGIATTGNAAGNTKDVFDLTGANVAPKPLPAGFTARGIVALVFSVIAAFLGMAVISWYGYQPLKE